MTDIADKPRHARRHGGRLYLRQASANGLEANAIREDFHQGTL